MMISNDVQRVYDPTFTVTQDYKESLPDLKMDRLL